jgi:hypothetical protein
MKYSKTKQKVHKIQENNGKTNNKNQPHKAAGPVEEWQMEDIILKQTYCTQVASEDYIVKKTFQIYITKAQHI